MMSGKGRKIIMIYRLFFAITYKDKKIYFESMRRGLDYFWCAVGWCGRPGQVGSEQRGAGTKARQGRGEN